MNDNSLGVLLLDPVPAVLDGKVPEVRFMPVRDADFRSMIAAELQCISDEIPGIALSGYEEEEEIQRLSGK